MIIEHKYVNNGKHCDADIVEGQIPIEIICWGLQGRWEAEVSNGWDQNTDKNDDSFFDITLKKLSAPASFSAT